MKKPNIFKFAAKLLFQYRTQIGRTSNKRRYCEERIILIEAKSPQEALKKAKIIGRNYNHKYLNDEQNKVYVEFVGVMQLIHLGLECSEYECWYEIKEYLTPMERKNKLIPNEKDLLAMRK